MHKYHRRLIERLQYIRLRFHTSIVRLSPRISVGNKTLISPGVVFKFEGSGRVSIGEHCRIDKGVILEARAGTIEIGNHVSINSYALLNGTCGVKIGNHCRIATQAVIVSGNHGVAPDELIRRQPVVGRGVAIGNDVWIAANAVILDGAQIPDGCVIGAGAVVTPRPMISKGIYGGVPAKLIKSRDNRESE